MQGPVHMAHNILLQNARDSYTEYSEQCMGHSEKCHTLVTMNLRLVPIPRVLLHDPRVGQVATSTAVPAKQDNSPSLLVVRHSVVAPR